MLYILIYILSDVMLINIQKNKFSERISSEIENKNCGWEIGRKFYQKAITADG